MRFRIILVSLAIGTLLAAAHCGRGSASRISRELREGWQFRHPDSSGWLDASVPGSIYSDLLAQGQIPDPFFADNEPRVGWVSDCGWEYRCRFDLPAELLIRERIDLVFEGLDTYAAVTLNGRPILTADNMYRTWRVPVGALLRRDNNELLVRFQPVRTVEKHLRDRFGFDLPGGGRVFTRKAGFHYGWDWGPKLAGVGVWRPVRMDAWSGARIRSLLVRQDRVDAREAHLTVRFEIESSSDRARARIALGDREREVVLLKGVHSYDLPLVISDPVLWWPNGYGGQYLYQFEGSLQMGGATVDTRRVRTGLRTIGLITRPDSVGETFYFTVNGKPVFIKGANYIPQDNLQSRVTRERYRRMIANAKGAHMNMLRVWGGGIYEEDLFYDLCDENGILVWQDFMFACAMYPGDSLFLESVAHEAADNVKRLRNHPSIALWCGNNEVSEGWHRWGWQEGLDADRREAVWRAYQNLFQRLLPAIVDSLAPGGSYWETSPRYGRGDPRHQFEGDAHYWGVWHDAEPFTAYEMKVPRFMSEFGFQSFPALTTLERFIPDSIPPAGSSALDAHQKHPRGFALIDLYLQREYREPNDFAALVYLSQVLQAEGITRGIEAHRRARPFCMGTLYWQLNDCWPAVSWSSVDYYGNWKALHYAVKRAYADRILTIAGDENILEIFAVSDHREPIAADLRLALIDFDGAARWDTLMRVAVPAESSVVLQAIDVRRFAAFDRARTVFTASLLAGDSIIASDLHLFDLPRNLALTPPGISWRVSPSPTGCTIHLRSKRFAKSVCLRGPAEGFFSDNYFDLLPRQERNISFHTTGAVAKNRFSIISLYDSYHQETEFRPPRSDGNGMEPPKE